jgi:hypothetical protein
MKKFPNVMVVGMHFRGAQAVAAVANMVPPLAITLEPEPENPYDQNAIKAIYQDFHLGYLERGQAAFIAQWLSDGYTAECVVQSLQQKGKNLHPVVDIILHEPA